MQFVSLSFGEFVFDVEARALSRAGLLLKVDAKLLQLLAYFVANPGRLISKRELLEQVWEGRAVADNVLSVSVAKLRKILEHQPGVRELIENRYGLGYRFVPEVTAVEAAPKTGLQPPPSAAGPSTPLVGRAAPLARLDAALQRARVGRGSVCLLVGEPGIGKTHLAEVLEQRALASGFGVAWGHCQPAERTPPLWSFVQVLRELRDRGAIEGGEVPKLESFAHRQRAAAAPTLSRALLYDAARESHGTNDAVTQILLGAAKARPLVIILDDIQWADAASLQLLSDWVGEIARWPMLVVATQRSTEPSSVDRRDPELLRLHAHANCERIQLKRLVRADIDEYLRGMFGERGGELGGAVFERSEGNPFFMIELLRPWLGSTQPRPDQLQMSGAALDLVRHRLRNMPRVSVAVLSAAAVIGQTFDLGLLSEVTQRPADELLEALDESLANDTVVASELGGAYAFDHALIREVLYDDLPWARRCVLHVLTGEALARRRAAGYEVTGVELAHHFLAALPHGDVSVAVSHAREAAASATMLAAHADARDLLLRALASFQFAASPDPEARTAVLLELAMVERVLADPTYFEHLAQGAALARKLRLGSMLTLAGRFLSPGPGLIVNSDAHDVLEAAAEVGRTNGEAQRAVALAHLSWTPPSCWSARRVQALITEATELARRSGDREAIAAAQDAAQHFAGPPALHRADDRLEIERELCARPSRVALWLKCLYRLFGATQRGDQAGVERALADMNKLHDRLANAELLWHHERLLLIQRMNHGQWLDVGADLDRLRERAQRLRLQAWRPICVSDSILFLWSTSDSSALARAIRKDLAPAPNDSPNTRTMKLRILAEHGFVDDVREQLALLTPEALRDLPHDRDYLAVLCDLAVGCVAATDLEHGRLVFELLQPYAEYHAIGISFHCQGSVSRYLGNVSWLLGDSVRAIEFLKRAEAQNRRFGLMGCLAHTQLDLAKALLAPGPAQDEVQGRQWLNEAQQLSAALGMQPVQRAALQVSRTV